MGRCHLRVSLFGWRSTDAYDAKRVFAFVAHERLDGTVNLRQRELQGVSNPDPGATSSD
jgi:hypothetical protein